MAIVSLRIDGRSIQAREGESVLNTAKAAGIAIPSLCHLEGLSETGSCRLCLVEVQEGRPLVPACVTAVSEGMNIRTDTESLRLHRRTVVEFLFAAGNHTCAVCVANGCCELQDAAVDVGMDHVGFEYAHRRLLVDLSHELFGMDPNRCILCTRCVRVCAEVEGAHSWGVAGRGVDCRVAIDLDQPWGESTTCTSCGKCVAACPTGAIFDRGDTVSGPERHRDRLANLITTREPDPWPA